MREPATAMSAHAIPDADALALRLSGHALPGRECLIPAGEVSRVLELAGGQSNTTHPVFACIVALRDLGVSIAGLCALCQFDLADGPLLGECEIEFDQALQPGTRYRVSGTIESYERGSSRRLGILDRLRFAVVLATPEGAPVARVRFLWLLPRGRIGHE